MINVQDIDIHELLPQQEPFVMVSGLLSFSMEQTVTKFVVAANNLFVDNGELSASGLMENIAQTCAARIGYINKYILHRGIQIGVIGAVRNFSVQALPKVGDTVVTTIDVIDSVFGMTLVNATAVCGDSVLATAQMKIAVREDDDSKSEQDS